jgi:hypothetical protein
VKGGACVVDHEEEDQHAERDRHVGDVERRPAERELDEVGHGAVADTVGDVADRAADQHPGGEPDQLLAAVQGEVDEQGDEREADYDRHGDVAAGEEAEGDAVVARVDELHAGQELLFFALHDRGVDGVL